MAVKVAFVAAKSVKSRVEVALSWLLKKLVAPVPCKVVLTVKVSTLVVVELIVVNLASAAKRLSMLVVVELMVANLESVAIKLSMLVVVELRAAIRPSVILTRLEPKVVVVAISTP